MSEDNLSEKDGFGETDSAFNIPYSLQHAQNAFGHVTQVAGTYFNTPDTRGFAYNKNNRAPSWSYDENGNITNDDDAAYQYDASNRLIRTTAWDPDTGLPGSPTRDSFDGDGNLLKRTANEGSATNLQVNYFVRSELEKALENGLSSTHSYEIFFHTIDVVFGFVSISES